MKNQNLVSFYDCIIYVKKGKTTYRNTYKEKTDVLFMNRITPILRSMKPFMWLSICILLFLGACTAEQLVSKGLSMYVGFFGIALFYSGAMAMMNDYWDRERDIINHPERAIPSGAVTEKQFLLLAAFIVLCSLGVLFLAAPHAFFKLLPILFVFEILNVVYSKYPSLESSGFGRHAFFFIPFAFLMVVTGALIAGEMTQKTYVIGGVMAYFSFLNPIAKDFADVVGDEKGGARTIPVIYGRKKAAQILGIHYIISYALIVILLVSRYISLFSLPIFALSAIGTAYVSREFMKDAPQSFAKPMGVGALCTLGYDIGLIVGVLM